MDFTTKVTRLWIMFLPQLIAHTRKALPVVRKGGPDPSLRYFLVEDSEAFLRVINVEPRFAQVHLEQSDEPVFPLLLEAWDDGIAWSVQIPLELALATDWRPG